MQLSDGIERVLPIIIGDPKEVLKKLPLLQSYMYQVWDINSKRELAVELKRMLAKTPAPTP